MTKQNLKITTKKTIITDPITHKSKQIQLTTHPPFEIVWFFLKNAKLSFQLQKEQKILWKLKLQQAILIREKC